MQLCFILTALQHAPSGKDVQILCRTNSVCQQALTWAARYDSWLLITLTLKGVVFSFSQQPMELWHDQFDDDMQVFILPTIRINNGQYRGKLAYAEVLQAICAGFSYGAEPSVCMQEDTCREGSQPDTDCKAK